MSTILGAYHFIWCTPRILVDTKNSAYCQVAPRAGYRNIITKDVNTREGPMTFLKVIINIKLLRSLSPINTTRDYGLYNKSENATILQKEAKLDKESRLAGIAILRRYCNYYPQV